MSLQGTGSIQNIAYRVFLLQLVLLRDGIRSIASSLLRLVLVGEAARADRLTIYRLHVHRYLGKCTTYLSSNKT